MSKVQLELTLDQAQTLAYALDLYTRLGLGQVEQISELARFGVIPKGTSCQTGSADTRSFDQEDLKRIDECVSSLKASLGYASNSSWGIGSDHVPLMAKRAYEVCKAIRQALSMARDPNPRFKWVDYDGVTVRYTKDDLPSVQVVDLSGSENTKAKPKP